jgi:hypothetical protein
MFASKAVAYQSEAPFRVATTLSVTTFSITTLSVTTFSITTLSVTTFSITTLIIMELNNVILSIYT